MPYGDIQVGNVSRRFASIYSAVILAIGSQQFIKRVKINTQSLPIEHLSQF